MWVDISKCQAFDYHSRQKNSIFPLVTCPTITTIPLVDMSQSKHGHQFIDKPRILSKYENLLAAMLSTEFKFSNEKQKNKKNSI